MRIFYLSPNLSSNSTGGTAVGKANLNMLQTLFGDSVTAYAVSRTAMNGPIALRATNSKLATAFANMCGMCATLTFDAKREFMENVLLHQPDIIWLDTSLFGLLIPEIRKKSPQTKIITYFHNVEVDLETQRLKDGALHYLPAWLATHFNENLSARDSDAICAITEVDGRRINQIYCRKVTDIVPVSLPALKHYESFKPDSDSVLFVGSEFKPNIEGLKFLNFQVAPLLKTTRILVAGRGLGRHLDGRVHKRIELLDFVENLSKVYSQTKLSLAPIFSGGGMKVKIAESLKHNRPVISTNFAAIGYESASADSILRVDTAVNFANAIEDWIPSDPNAADKDFLEYYSYDASIKKIKKIITNVMD